MIPEYGQLNQYRDEYNRKECFREEFKMRLEKEQKGEVLVCDKKSSSSLDLIKSKILKVAEKDQSGQKKQKQNS